MTNNLKITTKTGFDSGDENYTFSLWKQEYLVKDDGSETPIGEVHRMAVTPLDMEMVKDFVWQSPDAKENHSVVESLSHIWTDEVIKRYKEAAEAAMEEMEEGLVVEEEPATEEGLTEPKPDEE